MGLKLVSGEPCLKLMRGLLCFISWSVPAPFSKLLRDYKLPNLGMANIQRMCYHSFLTCPWQTLSSSHRVLSCSIQTQDWPIGWNLRFTHRITVPLVQG